MSIRPTHVGGYECGGVYQAPPRAGWVYQTPSLGLHVGKAAEHAGGFRLPARGEVGSPLPVHAPSILVTEAASTIRIAQSLRENNTRSRKCNYQLFSTFF